MESACKETAGKVRSAVNSNVCFRLLRQKLFTKDYLATLLKINFLSIISLDLEKNVLLVWLFYVLLIRLQLRLTKVI